MIAITEYKRNMKKQKMYLISFSEKVIIYPHDLIKNITFRSFKKLPVFPADVQHCFMILFAGDYFLTR